MPKVNVKKGTVRVGTAAKGDVQHVRPGDDANPITVSQSDADSLIARGVAELVEETKKPAKSSGEGRVGSTDQDAAD